MKIQTTLALAAATLALGVPVATAAPDGHQPQLQPTAQPDGYQPQLQANAQPDAIARYLRGHSSGAESTFASTGAAGHPDSRAVRAGAGDPVVRAEDSGYSWEIGALGTLGGVLIVLVALIGASAMRERRRLVLR